MCKGTCQNTHAHTQRRDGVSRETKTARTTDGTKKDHWNSPSNNYAPAPGRKKRTPGIPQTSKWVVNEPTSWRFGRTRIPSVGETADQGKRRRQGRRTGRKRTTGIPHFEV